MTSLRRMAAILAQLETETPALMRQLARTRQPGESRLRDMSRGSKKQDV